MSVKKYRELKPEELRHECNLKDLDFNTTDEIKLGDEMIGQERALKAIDFGLNIKSEGFNIYASGLAGTGRNTAILRAVKKIAKNEPIPDDLCYLYNFDLPDEPKALKVSAGLGRKLKREMDEFNDELEFEIQKRFISEEYEKQKKDIVENYEKKQEKISTQLQVFANSKGFVIQQTAKGLFVVPGSDGKPLTEDEFQRLPADQKKKIKETQQGVYKKLDDYMRDVREIRKALKNAVQKLDEKIAVGAIGHLLHDLKKDYKNFKMVIEHLDDIQKDIVKNLDAFKKDEPAQQLPFIKTPPSKDKIMDKYRINLIVDNSSTKGAPVILEHNPIYYNLTGKVEYRAQFGILTTDFSMIRAGSAHKANGGYLIIQAKELLRDYFAWDALKKMIRYKMIKIENLAERYGLAATAGLKPQPVPVNLKVILIGSRMIYHLLYNRDEDFRKLFKVKADFDSVMKRSKKTLHKYAYFIAKKCREEKLLPFRKCAVARIVDYGSRICAHKEKLSTRFFTINDIMREADYWARKEKAKIVKGEHVLKALQEKEYRSNMIEDKIQEMIKEDTIRIDTKGSEIGQINGLAVLSLGDYAFGKPSRITAKTFIGRGNIINIEREAKMSGKIHSKGVLILGGYLGEKFAQEKALSLSASICFEQLYDQVDGDSASSTELYCLLSSLAGLPLRQDLAVTGSISQRGEVQAVGGINQKIEGFYHTCKLAGITGTQGVMIPESNIKFLMLKDEVIEAVKNGKFHIYPVKTIDQGIEILTGRKAGEKGKHGKYPTGTVYYKVFQKLKKYSQKASKKDSKKSSDKKKKEEKNSRKRKKEKK